MFTQPRVKSFLLVLAICGLGIFSLGEGNAKVNITYWHPWGGHWGKIQMEVVDIFNRTYPEIKATSLTVPQAQMKSKLLTTIAGGNPPDVVCRWAFDLGFSPDMFIPLDSFIRENEELMGPQNWYPGALDYIKFEGKRYGLPIYLGSGGLWYNIDMFEEAGLDPQNPPKYWSELEVAAEKLTKKDSQGRYVRLGLGIPGVLFYIWRAPTQAVSRLPLYSYRNNARWWDPETRKMTLTDPKNVETWRWIRSWHEKYGLEEIDRFLQSLKGVMEENTGGLAEEKFAMREEGNWMTSYVGAINPDLNYDVTMTPYPKDGKPVTLGSVNSLHISRGSKHLQEAWIFVSWMVTEGAAVWCSRTGDIPGRYDATEAANFEKLPRYDLFKKTIDYLEYVEIGLPGFPLKSIMGEHTLRYFEEMTHLKISPEKALEELQTVMQKELDEFYEK